MNRQFRATVPESFEGARLDAFLGASSAFESRSAAVKSIEAGDVCVNGAVVTSKKHVLREGDAVEATVVEEEERLTAILEPEKIPLDIRYEDEHIIVLSKQRGLVCHPSPGHPSHTLSNALVAHCGADNLGLLQGTDRPGIVHRLDMDTTGLMLAAKDDACQGALQEAIRLKSVDRRYVTLVHGYIAPETGIVDAPIARCASDRLKMTVSDDIDARQSVTTFVVLERFEAGRRDEGYTLLECKLFTGRTHQIRVHMSYIGHPVVGDPLYGRGSLAFYRGLDRQFLHSWSLKFTHPATGEELSFVDAPPWDLTEVLDGLESRSMGRSARGEEIAEAMRQQAELAAMGW